MDPVRLAFNHLSATATFGVPGLFSSRVFRRPTSPPTEDPKRITEQYFLPNLSFEELHVLARSGAVDPLKSFGEACRIELKSMRATV